MTLIHFMDMGKELQAGISGNVCVASIEHQSGSWFIRHCIGHTGQSPKFPDCFSAQQACNAYMAKFLLDIGFGPIPGMADKKR